MLERAIDSLAREFDKRIVFAKVDFEGTPQQLLDCYHITSVPTVILFREGTVYYTLVGLNSLRVLKFRLDELARNDKSKRNWKGESRLKSLESLPSS